MLTHLPVPEQSPPLILHSPHSQFLPLFLTGGHCQAPTLFPISSSQLILLLQDISKIPKVPRLNKATHGTLDEPLLKLMLYSILYFIEKESVSYQFVPSTKPRAWLKESSKQYLLRERITVFDNSILNQYCSPSRANLSQFLRKL